VKSSWSIPNKRVSKQFGAVEPDKIFSRSLYKLRSTSQNQNLLRNHIFLENQFKQITKPKMSVSSRESGYSSNEEETQQPILNVERIKLDAIRLAEEFEIEKLLVKSVNGVLYTGRDLTTGQRVIFKQIPRYSVSSWSKMDGFDVPSEIFYHFKAASHDTSGCIVRPITWLEKKSSFVLVMEHIQKSCDLFDLSQKYGALGEEQARIIFGQIIQMAEILEKSGISHRDIKDENIIIDLTTLQVKLIDFGCATADLEGQHEDFSGTPEFYPPEFWRTRQYKHSKLTIWSMGLVLYILLFGNLPFNSVKNIPQFDISCSPATFNLSPTANRLLKSLLSYDPRNRANIALVKQLYSEWRA